MAGAASGKPTPVRAGMRREHEHRSHCGTMGSSRRPRATAPICSSHRRSAGWTRVRWAGKPFFAYIPLNAAHTPHVVPEKCYQQYLGKPRVTEYREVYGMRGKHRH